MNLLYLLLYNLTLLNPTLQSTLHTHTHTLNSTSSIKSKVQPSLKPSEAGIPVKTLCRCPHCSVAPTTGTHLPEEGRYKKVYELNQASQIESDDKTHCAKTVQFEITISFLFPILIQIRILIILSKWFQFVIIKLVILSK